MSCDVQINRKEVTLRLLLQQGELSASKLSSLMAISVQAVRRHLRNLEEDGLVESVSVCLGPGRPSNLWHLTSSGQDYFNSGNGSEKFAIDLLSTIQESLSSQALAQVLSKQALDQAISYRKRIGAGSINKRLQRLVELRNKEGNTSSIKSCDDGSKSWYLNAFHCSVRDIAEQFPLICDQELQLIRYIFPDCVVERVQWRLETAKSCGFKITPNLG